MPAEYWRAEQSSLDPTEERIGYDAASDGLALVGLPIRRASGKQCGKNPFTGAPVIETQELLIASTICDAEVMDGAIPVCHEGCNLVTWLVVSGPERGNVWRDLRADYQGIVPVSRPGRPRLGFAEWYEDWLDASLAQALGSD